METPEIPHFPMATLMLRPPTKKIQVTVFKRRQVRFPTSKKKRIRAKWRKNELNWSNYAPGTMLISEETYRRMEEFTKKLKAG